MAYLLTTGVLSVDHPWAKYLAQFRPAASRDALKAGVLTPEVAMFWNSARPSGTNDGALWQGKGATAAGSAGVFAKLGPLSAAFRPTYILTQNREFELSPLKADTIFSEYAYATLVSRLYPYATSTIDWPQRFGSGGFSTTHLGQSFVRLDFRGLGIGVSSENLWWGPGIQSSISMTNNAAGIPHTFIGTSYPLDVWLGELEGRWLWGKLNESDFYDQINENDKRFFTTIALAFSPRVVRNLSFGLTRSYIKNLDDEGIETGDYFLVFQNVFKKALTTPENPSGLDLLDQMITIFGRWLLPKSRFEMYGEWAKGDHSWDLRDAIVQLQHGSGYSAGFQKVIEANRRKWYRISGEVTKLEAPKSDIVRGQGSYFYQHEFVRHGYTHGGQIIGAGMGPGSNSQFIGADMFASWGRAGAFVQRIAYDNDRYYRSEPDGEDGHQVEWIFGGRGLIFYRGFEMESSVSLGRMLNKYYVEKNDETNVHLTLSVRRSIGGYR